MYGTAEVSSLDETSVPGKAPRVNKTHFTRSVRSVVLALRLKNAKVGEAAPETVQEHLAEQQANEVEPTNYPTAWNDMSNDLNGMRSLAEHGSIVLLALAATSTAGMLALALHAGPTVLFWLSFLALLPLAVQLGDLTEIAAAWCGPVAGGLINASFGNATELIVMISAVRHGLVGIEQAALLGGVLSNMLLVLGCAFIAGGVSAQRGQTFSSRVVNATLGVLFVACLGVVLPTAFALIRGGGAPSASTLSDSRVTAFALLFMYANYLVFTLWPATARAPLKRGDSEQPLLSRQSSRASGSAAEEAAGDAAAEGDEEASRPTMSIFCVVLLLGVITTLVAVFANALIVSVFPVAAVMGIPPDFIAVCLIPVVGNIAELVSAVMAASKSDLDLALAIGLGSATQIALFLVPVAVLFGWAIGVPMSLDFEPTFALAFFGAVVAVALLLQDGEAHWLKGSLLISAYVIIVAGMAFNGSEGANGPAAAPAAQRRL